MLDLTWQYLTLLLAFLVTVVGGAIQIGTLKNQININTDRLQRLEDQSLEFLRHKADTDARWPDIERRLHRTETIINHVTIKKEYE